jgi:hypothetical protein
MHQKACLVVFAVHFKTRFPMVPIMHKDQLTLLAKAIYVILINGEQINVIWNSLYSLLVFPNLPQMFPEQSWPGCCICQLWELGARQFSYNLIGEKNVNIAQKKQQTI